MQNDLREIEEAGFKAIFLTVDNPSEEGVRTRSRRAGGPDSRYEYSILFTKLAHSIAAALSNTHSETLDVSICALLFAEKGFNDCLGLNFQLAAFAALQNQTSLIIIPKGISNWQDVALVHSLGFPACYISNHGGRLIDGQQTAAEVLLDVRKNAPEALDDGKMEIYADGGVRHGSDILKLLALGARAVGLGRSYVQIRLFNR